MTDWELLARYVAEQDQQAFGELVRRHIDWVYSCARRLVRDQELAKDVTQAVFLLLVRKAAGVKQESHLAGWLFRATRFCANEAMRREQRRRKHEREAAMRQQMEAVQEQVDWEEVWPVLDAAVERLGKGDREAVLLRFCRGMSLAEVGQGLGVSEEAAKKRVQRAVEKLRGVLAKRGVVAGVAVLSAVLAERVTEAAPVGVVESVAGTGTGSTGAVGIVKGAMKMMVWAKVKVVAAAAGVMLVAGGLGVTAGQSHAVGSTATTRPDVATAVRPTGESPDTPIISGIPAAKDQWVHIHCELRIVDPAFPHPPGPRETARVIHFRPSDATQIIESIYADHKIVYFRSPTTRELWVYDSQTNEIAIKDWTESIESTTRDYEGTYGQATVFL